VTPLVGRRRHDEQEPAIGSLFGVSLKLFDRRAHREWLERRRSAFGAALALAALAPALQLLLALTILNVWYRMAAAGLVLSVLALRYADVGWRELYRPSLRHLLTGIAAAFVLYAGGWAVVRALREWPAAAAQIAGVYGWKNAVPGATALPLLLLIVFAEEIVWRGAVGLPFAARWGPWRGTLIAGVAFAAAHIPMGVPVLVLAALAAGTFWSALVAKTRSGVPALVSHLLWDFAVLFWLPYLT
jgi:membrane protease YdiL (CAAX protease family)